MLSLLALVSMLVLAGACSREKDPYRDWKAPQLFEEGDRLLRANDLAGADVAFRRGLLVAEKAGYPPGKTRGFLIRLFGVAAAKENLAEAEKLFARAGGDANPPSMDVRPALQLVLMRQRANKTDEARALAEKLAVRFAAKPPSIEDLPAYAVGWIVIDRLRTANVEIGRARQASDAVIETLMEFAGNNQGISPGLRPWISRYIDHLFDSDRTLVGQQIGELVTRIDQLAPAPTDSPACLPLDDAFPILGCLPEMVSGTISAGNRP